MTNINERFAALTRARKGTTTVIIVEEDVLAELIGDAQAAEARLFEEGIKRAGPPPQSGSSAEPIRMINITTPPPPPNAGAILVESVRRSRLRTGRAW